MIPLAYRLVSRLAHNIPLPSGSLSTSLAGRKAAAARWVDWASTNRTAGPLVWVHAASVGESLTATPVVDRIRARVSGVQIVHSFTSPAALSWGSELPVDNSDYLPLDDRDVFREVCTAVSPSIFVCSRGDLWPEMAFVAASRTSR